MVGRRHGRSRTTTAPGISVANDDGSFPRLARREATATQPTFSLDGNTVAFIKAGDLFTINSDGTGGELRLTNTAARRSRSRVLARRLEDRVRVATSAQRDYDLWIVTVGGGAPFAGDLRAGRRAQPVLVARTARRSSTRSAGELFTVAAAASSTPTDLHVAGHRPAFSPDGSKIAYINAAAISPSSTRTARARQTIDVERGRRAARLAGGRVRRTGTGRRNVSYPTINLPVRRLASRSSATSSRRASARGTARSHHVHSTSGSAATRPIRSTARA